MSIMIKAMTTCAVHKKGNCTQSNVGKGLGLQTNQVEIYDYTGLCTEGEDKQFMKICLLNKCTK